jgi:hypothetical protein
VAGLGFLATFFHDAIAPASISTAFADAIAFSVLLFSRMIPQKQQKQKKKRPFYCALTLVSFGGQPLRVLLRCGAPLDLFAVAE